LLRGEIMANGPMLRHRNGGISLPALMSLGRDICNLGSVRRRGGFRLAFAQQ
jgi:hypothetical protein